MSGFEVQEGGLATTVQDRGRMGLLHLGVPAAGALDPIALRLANALVGNPPHMAGLEVLGLGPRLRLMAASARIAVVGPARLSLERAGETRSLEPGRSHHLIQGDVLAVGALSGARVAMLAVSGGFAIAPVMGSASVYTRAALGPLGGKALSQGMVLPLARGEAGEGDDLALDRPFDYGAGPIRVMAGPQADRFTTAAWETFLGAQYRVGREADRMGMRLDGPVLEHLGKADIASEGLAAGSIQVPGNGQPIVLLADRQTVGGYAKIATVISADLPRLARLSPGAPLSFQLVSREAADAARVDLARRLERAERGIIRIGGGLDLTALYGSNLVSGMVGPEGED
jgi:biotin-dependent carboxylase-like uncharacterized protein